MKRILILGCCGAGKSTFAKKLEEKIPIELVHLDQYFWKPDWTETKPEEWKDIVERLSKKNEWIIDGNYGGTLDIRLSRADTIIYFDFSTLKCLWRVTKRIIKHHGKVRPDMPPGCNERFDLEFYHYVALFNFIKRKKILNKLKGLKHKPSIFIFSSDKEADKFLVTLR